MAEAPRLIIPTMRISAFEHEQIVTTARSHFGANSRVVLFGSRVDDGVRGGDIDLLIEATGPIDKPIQREAAFLIDLWQRVGEQRIDVVLVGSDSPPQKIHSMANALGIEL